MGKLYCFLNPGKYSEETLASYAAPLISDAFAHIERYADDWKKNERRLRGDVWEGSDDGRFRMAFPETANILRRVAAMLTERTPRVTAFPASLGTTAEAADIMTEIIQAIWAAQHLDDVFIRIIEAGMTYGVAIALVSWNGAEGYPEFRYMSPYSVGIPEGHGSLREAPYFVTRRVMSGYQIKRLYDLKPDDFFKLESASAREEAGTRVSGVGPEDEAPTVDSGTNAVSRNAWVSVQKVSLGEHSKGRATSAVGEEEEEFYDRLFRVYDLWVRDEGERWHRYQVSGYAVLDHRMEDVLRYHEYKWWPQTTSSWPGHSLVSLLVPLQRYIDTMYTNIATNIERTADPIEVVSVDVVGLQSHSYAQEGRRVIVPAGTPPGAGIWWLNPAQIPAEVFTSIQLCLQAMMRVPGIDTLGAEEERKQRKTATEMVQLAERRHQVLRKDGRLVAHFTARVATAMMNMLAELQTEDLMIPSVSYLYSGEDVRIPANAFRAVIFGEQTGEPMRFKAIVDDGLGLPKSQLTDLGFALYNMSIIDAESLVELFLDVPGGRALVKRAQERQAETLQRIQKGGENADLRRDNQESTESGTGAENRGIPGSRESGG